MFDSPLVTAWLLTYALHSTLFLGLAWMTSRWLAKRMPAVEEAAWRFALIAGLITASLQIAAGHEPLAGRWDLARTEVPASSMASEPLLLASSPRQAAPAERPAVLSGTTGAASVGSSLPALPRLSAAALLAGIWTFCALLLAARWAGIRLLLRRRLRPRPEVVEGTMVSLLLRLVGQARLPWAVRLSCSSRLPVPVALGVRRPEICVPPRSLVGLAPEEQEGMLAHELAHLVRRDPFWLAFSQLVASVFFFQPLNWVACRRMREISELLCDEWAVGRTGRPVSLARCLAEVAGWSLHPAGPLAVPSMADRPSNLSHRIRRLLDEARSPERKIRPAWLAAGMIALLLAVAAAAPGVSAVTRDSGPSSIEGDSVLASEEPREGGEAPPESGHAELEAELAEIDHEVEVELAEVDAGPDLDLDVDIDPDIDLAIHPDVDFDFVYDFDFDSAGLEAVAMMADFELSPEEAAALEALGDRYGKIAEEMAERMEPRIEEMQRKLDEDLSRLQDSGEMAKLEAEMEAIAERARPSEEEMERLHQEIEKLRAEGGLSAEERARIRAEAKRLADQHRLSEEDRARIRDLQRQSREVHERFMREHRDEIEKIRRDALEQSRLIREEVQRQLQNDPELRKLRERSLRERDRERQERQKERQKERERDKDRGERQVRVEVDPQVQVQVQVAAAPVPAPEIRVEVAPRVEVKAASVEAKARAEAKIEKAQAKAEADAKAKTEAEVAEPPL